MKAGNTLALMSAASAALVRAETIKVFWGTTLNTGEEIISASLNGSVISSACANKLTLGNLDIEVAADDTGAGVIAVGDKHYTIDEDICDAAWSSRFIEVECTLPWEGELEVDVSLSSANAATMETCFASEEEQEVLFELDPEEAAGDEEDEQLNLEEFEEFEEEDTTPAEGTPSALFRRQGGFECIVRPVTVRASPVNPRKWRRHRQLSQTLDCGTGNGGTCNAVFGETFSVTHTATFSASAAGGWISAEYKVSQTRSTSQKAVCGGVSGQRVCVKSWRRFQQYDVWSGHQNPCTKKWLSERKTSNIRSPLTHVRHQEMYCARGSGSCNWEGHTHWEDRGRGTHDGA